MKTYEVTITETLETTVKIKASSREEAEVLAESRWSNGEYILGAEQFTGVSFKARLPERERGMAR